MSIHKSAVLGLAAVTLCSAMADSAMARELTVVGWGGSTQAAQHQIYMTPYAKALGKPVLEESWDGGYGVLQAKVKAGTPNWDVVQVEADELALGCADGLYEKLDWSKIGSRKDFIKGADSDCGVGAYVWSTALAYDTTKFANGGPRSWADFFDVAKFPGKRALRKGAKYNLEFALMADGVPADQVYSVLATPAGVDRAFKKLDQLKPYLVWWESGAQPAQLISSGEVAMSSAYSGRISAFNASEKAHLKIVWPDSIYATDSWVILRGSPNAASALGFIAFASNPTNQAKLPSIIAWGPTNKTAAAQVPVQFQTDLPTTAQNMAVAQPLNVDFWVDNSEALTQRFNAWLAQ